MLARFPPISPGSAERSGGSPPRGGRWPDGGGRLTSRSLGHVVHDQVARRVEAVPQSWFPAGKAAVPFPFCAPGECPCNPQNR